MTYIEIMKSWKAILMVNLVCSKHRSEIEIDFYTLNITDLI